ncbi:unnamed protein product, partial [Symbiodinium necroappetens]
VARRAVDTAPGPVRALQFLTVPVPGEPLQHAGTTLQHAMPMEPDLALRISDGRLLVMDVAGLIQEALPTVLTEIQWLRIERPIWDEVSAMSQQRMPAVPEALRYGMPAGLSNAFSTTSTTTGMLRDGVRIYRIRLFGNGKEVAHDVQAPCQQLDLVLCLLLGKLQHTAPNTCGPASIMMAKAQPPATGDVQEVLFLSHQTDVYDMVSLFVDGRPQGGSLVLAQLPRLTSTEHAIPESVRGAGCFALINGSPAHLAQRPVMHGDYVQLGCSGVFVPHVAAQGGKSVAAFGKCDYDRWASTWASATENGYSIRADCGRTPGGPFISMTEFNGMHLAMAYTTAQIPGAALFVTVCPQSDLRTVLLPLAPSPAHYIVLMIPSLAEDLGYLPLDPQQRPMTGGSMAKYWLFLLCLLPWHALSTDISGRHVQSSGKPTVLLVGLSPEVAPHLCKSVIHGQPNRFDVARRPVNGKLMSTSLALKVQAEVLKESHAPLRRIAIPTPSGRRHVPAGEAVATDTSLQPSGSGSNGVDAPQIGARSSTSTPRRAAICLDTAIAPPAVGLGFGLAPDMLDFLLLEHALHDLATDLPALPDLLSAARAGWTALEEWNRSEPLHGLQLFTDGSFFPSSSSAGWSVVVLGSCAGRAVRVGFMCGTCPGFSAYQGELCALVHARALALSVRPLPVAVASDCTSALQVAFGAAGFEHNDDFARALAGLSLASTVFQQPVMPLHIRSHTGCAFNDTADALAKGAARGVIGEPMLMKADAFWAGVRERVCDWVWLLAPQFLSSVQLPYLSPGGTWTRASCEAPPSTSVDPAVLQPETRLGVTGVGANDDFWVVSAPCADAGVGGWQALSDFTSEFGLTSQLPVSTTGQPIRTWTSPAGKDALIDYVLVSSDWQSSLTTLDTPDLQVSWDTDISTHVQVFHRHLHDRLVRDLPHMPAPARHPAVTARHHRRAQLHALFTAWRAGTASHRQCRLCKTAANRLAEICAATLRVGKWVRAAMQQDKASFSRAQIEAARGAGPAKFAHLLRAITRQGRRFKPPKVLPVIRQDGHDHIGQFAVTKVLGASYAAAERASPVQPGDFLDSCKVSRLLETPIEVTVFASNPVAAALAYGPVILKLLARGVNPAQWSGGVAHSIPKGSKDPGSVQGWRAILLLETDAKAYQKAWRPQAIRALEHTRAVGQHGGIPKHTLEQPAALARAHLQGLSASGRSGGALFVDCAAAYYSIVRDFYFSGLHHSWTQDELVQRSRLFFDDAEDQDRFLAEMREGQWLRALQLPADLHRIVMAQLQDTWYIDGSPGTTLYATRSGTAPGSPVADALFAFLFSRFLRGIEAYLRDTGITPTVHVCCAQAGDAAAPTWADDVVILFTASGPSVVASTLASLGGQVVSRLRGHTPLRIVPAYVHLGTTLNAELSETANLKRRALMLYTAFKPIKHRLLRNPYLFFHEKRELILSRIIPAFLHGSGLWRLSTRHEVDLAHGPLNAVFRQCIRPLTGYSAALLTHDEVLSALDLPSVEELIRVHQARALAQVLRADMRSSWEGFTADGCWLRQACAAAALVFPSEDLHSLVKDGAPDDLGPLSLHFQGKDRQLRNACRHYLRQCRSARKPVDWKAVLLRQEQADHVEVIASSGPRLQFACHLCDVASRQRLCVHLSRRHGQLAQ